MTGTGAVFVVEAAAHGVDSVFLVAIAGPGTSFGRLQYARDGDQCAHNAFNWFYSPTWPQSDFAFRGEAIGRVAEGPSGDLSYGAGLYSVGATAPRYCPDSTAAWIANVTAFMLQLGDDPADTRLAPTGAAPQQARPVVVALAGAETLSRGARKVGGAVRVRFVITNKGGTAVTLEAIRLAVRGPGETRARPGLHATGYARARSGAVGDRGVDAGHRGPVVRLDRGSARRRAGRDR